MPCRKVRDESDARRLLAAADRSGLERAAWARQHGINARSLNAWRLILARKDQPAAKPRRAVEFLELVPAAVAAPSVLVVHVGAASVDVPDDFDVRGRHT